MFAKNKHIFAFMNNLTFLYLKNIVKQKSKKKISHAKKNRYFQHLRISAKTYPMTINETLAFLYFLYLLFYL